MRIARKLLRVKRRTGELRRRPLRTGHTLGKECFAGGRGPFSNHVPAAAPRRGCRRVCAAAPPPGGGGGGAPPPPGAWAPPPPPPAAPAPGAPPGGGPPPPPGERSPRGR